MPALLFGSISSIADTSELQRQSFNEAFAGSGLDWVWGQEEYAGNLASNGGQDRIAAYARERGEDVDAADIHRTKSAIFQLKLAASPVSARPGVVETIIGAKGAGLKVGLVTTTSAKNVAALLTSLGPDITPEDFDVVVDSTDVDQPKPDPAAYAFALDQLGEQQGACLAIEDNPGGVQAATAAGVPCIAFPNENTAGLDFAGATSLVDQLTWPDLSQHFI